MPMISAQPSSNGPTRVEPMTSYAYHDEAYPVSGNRINCPHCRHLLFKGELGVSSRIEIKCQCKRLVRFYVVPPVAGKAEPKQ
jgi:hypothetical protein